MKAQVIIVTGTSGAGKTTTCSTFARRADDLYFMFGMDLLSSAFVSGKFTMFGERKEDHLFFHEVDPNDPNTLYRMNFGPDGWRSIQAMHEMIAAAAKAGQPVLVDHIMLLDPPILQDCIWRLKDVPVLFVCLKPPAPALEKRLASREFALPPAIVEALGENAMEEIAKSMQRATPWLYEATYANDCYDIEIDTTSQEPEAVCALIEARLREGPGRAFVTLRDRYPDGASGFRPWQPRCKYKGKQA